MDSPSFEVTKNLNLLDLVNLRECGFSEQLKKCMEDDTSIIFEFAYKSVWNKSSWLRAYFTPVKENDLIVGSNIVLDDITEKKRSEQELQEKVFRDPLTSAYNRRALDKQLPDKLDQLKEKGLMGCIALLDIDNFKDINDKFGHKAGDSVLMHLAARVLKALREEDLLIRTGGDEFLIYLHDIREKKNASKFIKRIFEKITGTYRMTDDNGLPYTLDVRCSLGVSFFPADGEGVEILMSKADKSLYKVKDNGKDAYYIEY